MESYSEIYKHLTGVDINKEMSLWDERGKGYYGEFLVFCELMDKLPYPSKILMNLHIPTYAGKTTEIDLIAITTVGIIVYEIKNYKGTIYGSGESNVWTQYFKTQPNRTFQNPIKQNAYHCGALYKITHLQTYSVIVFTNNYCTLNLSNIYIPVCNLNYVSSVSSNIINRCNQTLSEQDIDKIFKKLSVYSNMSIPVLPSGNALNFCDWIYLYHDELVKYSNDYQQFLNYNKTLFAQKYENEMIELKRRNESVHNRYKIKQKALLIIGIISIVINFIISAILFTSFFKQKMPAENTVSNTISSTILTKK